MQIPVALSTLEQSQGQMLLSMAARQAKESVQRLNAGSKSASIDNLVDVGMQTTLKWPLYVNDRPQSLSTFRSWARRQVSKNGCRLVAIDYAQLLRPDKKYQSKEDQYSDYSMGLLGIAKELRVPLLVICRESNEGRLYGAGQWHYDAICWVRMTEHDRKPKMPVFSAQFEKVRFGDCGRSELLQLAGEGAYLRPYIPLDLDDGGI